MKKIISYFFLYIVFCLLQFFCGKYININGIFPNFILIIIVYLGLSRGVVDAELMGFLFGLTWDVFSTDIFGLRAVIFTIIGYLSGKIYKGFDKDKIISQFVIVFFANIIYWVCFSLIYFILSDDRSNSLSIAGLSGSIKIIITVLVAPVVFYILDRIGRYI
ncbi:MAG: rod shape-determining protein MreD [Endomicrobium sp.]|jgi:rod shape-determining protein MreD|nr:rod shape-determining protein MreD [Endomicrobium sp.]